MPSTREIAASLPDVPRWVHVRGLLLGGRGRIVGSITPSPLAFVVQDAPTGLAIVVGPAPLDCVQRAAAAAAEVLAFPENRERVSAALPHWSCEPAALHVRSERSRSLPSNRRAARLIPPGTAAALGHIPPDLAAELGAADARGTAIAAALHDDRPVAFCYATAITESLWDVSVDTLPAYRRQGMATAAARFLIDHWARLGRQPVWGAVQSNAASAQLAARLGFVAVDTLWVFRPPERVNAILLEFLQWVATRRRTYGETMQAWRSTCPRHTVWEEALGGGLIEVESGRPLPESNVLLSPRGSAVLARAGAGP